MKKIIITGSNGFLGSHIAEEFSRNSWHVTGIDRRPGSQKTECKTHISHIQSKVPSIHFDEILLSQQPDSLFTLQDHRLFLIQLKILYRILKEVSCFFLTCWMPYVVVRPRHD